MRLALRRNPSFTADVLRQFGWYWDEAGENVVWRFEARVEETLLAIVRQPNLGRPRRFRSPQLQGLRSILIGRPFNQLVLFYRVGADGVEAWRLMHGARDLPRRLVESPE